MLPYFILGVALLIGLLLMGRWFIDADPKTLAKMLKRLALGLVLALAVFLAVTGRLAWAMMTLPVLLPWLLRFRAMGRAAKNFSRMAAAAGGGSGAATGQSSDIETRFLRMSLDHDSGQMTGEVIHGPHAGRRLDQMVLDELLDLLVQCRAEDKQSVQILETYLDRVQPDWRERTETSEGETGTGTGAKPGGADMSRQEAYRVLGLEPGAGEQEIKDAYHRLIAGIHPDHGGSTYLAAQINQAKDILLGDR